MTNCAHPDLADFTEDYDISTVCTDCLRSFYYEVNDISAIYPDNTLNRAFLLDFFSLGV